MRPPRFHAPTRPLPQRLGLIILLAGAALLASADAATAVVAQPSRFEEPLQRPDSVIERTVTVTNTRDVSADVTVDAVAFPGDRVTVDPLAFRIPAGGSQEVHVRVDIPANASGGRHDARISFVESFPASAGSSTVARSAVMVPVVFHVDNLKIGGLTIDMDATGVRVARVVVQNYLQENAAPSVAVSVRDATGAIVHAVNASAGAIAADGTRLVDVPLAVSDLSPGRYTVSAVATQGDLASNTGLAQMLVGVAVLRLEAPVVTVDGNAILVSARILNDGDRSTEADIVATATHRVTGAAVTDRQTHGLDPGAVIPWSARLNVDAGQHDVVVQVIWHDGHVLSEPLRANVPGEENEAHRRGLNVGDLLGVPAPGAIIAVWVLAAVASIRRR